MGEFSPFSFCNIYFFQKFFFLHLKVLFFAKLYSSIEVIEKISYGDLQNMYLPFSLDKLDFLIEDGGHFVIVPNLYLGFCLEVG